MKLVIIQTKTGQPEQIKGSAAFKIESSEIKELKIEDFTELNKKLVKTLTIDEMRKLAFAYNTNQTVVVGGSIYKFKNK